MRKTIFIIMLLALLLSACGGKDSERDLSTPASRLVGHWEYREKNEEYFFSDIDRKTKEGNWTIYETNTGNVRYCIYRVLVQDKKGTSITASALPDRTKNVNAIVEDCGIIMGYVSEDGLSALGKLVEDGEYAKGEWVYIDDETEYKP